MRVGRGVLRCGTSGRESNRGYHAASHWYLGPRSNVERPGSDPCRKHGSARASPGAAGTLLSCSFNLLSCQTHCAEKVQVSNNRLTSIRARPRRYDSMHLPTTPTGLVPSEGADVLTKRS